jgi:hypothetical protein
MPPAVRRIVIEYIFDYSERALPPQTLSPGRIGSADRYISLMPVMVTIKHESGTRRVAAAKHMRLAGG